MSTACPKDHYSYRMTTGENRCIPCPIHTQTVSNASYSRAQCICNRGYSGPNGGPCEGMSFEMQMDQFLKKTPSFTYFIPFAINKISCPYSNKMNPFQSKGKRHVSFQRFNALHCLPLREESFTHVKLNWDPCASLSVSMGMY